MAFFLQTFITLLHPNSESYIESWTFERMFTPTTCHTSGVWCQVSGFTRQVSGVMCQRGIPCIVFKHLHSQTVKARELKCWEKDHLYPPVTCNVSHVTCHAFWHNFIWWRNRKETKKIILSSHKMSTKIHAVSNFTHSNSHNFLCKFLKKKSLCILAKFKLKKVKQFSFKFSTVKKPGNSWNFF